MSHGERIHLKVGFATSTQRKTTPHSVYANLLKHAAVADLVDSAAHEATHLRWQSLWGCSKPHSLFSRRKKALLDGYRCGPKGSRLPAAFR